MVAPVVAGSASASSNSSSYAVSVPAGTANGDLLIGVCSNDFGTFAGNSFPSGWTALTTSDFDGGTNAYHIGLWARVASSEPATYTISHDSSDSVAAILRITGWDSAAGIAGAVKQVAPSTTGTGTTAPSIVPFAADDLLITFHGAESSSGGSRTWTPPTGMTEDVDRQSTIWASLEVNHLANPSSPSGTKVATPSASVDTGAACTISIKAPGGGGTTILGAATGLFGFTGTAAGVDRAVGTAVGSFGFLAVASGTSQAPPVDGTASGLFGFTAAGSGVRRTAGVAAAAFSFTGTAVGVDRSIGTASGSFGFAAAASGKVTVIAAAVTGLGFTAAAVGVRTAAGTAVGVFGFTGTADGFSGTPPVQGTATGAFGFTGAATGHPRVIGGGSGAFGFTGTAVGVDRAVGTASSTFGFTAAATGLRRVVAAAHALFGFTGAAEGGPPPPPFFPVTDPFSSVRPNLATATARANAATATIRANTAEAP